MNLDHTRLSNLQRKLPHMDITPRTVFRRLLKFFRRQPVLSRDYSDSDAVEFVSGSDAVRSLVHEIKTKRGTKVVIR